MRAVIRMRGMRPPRVIFVYVRKEWLPFPGTSGNCCFIASQSLAINFVTAKVFRSGYHSTLKATVAIVTTINARRKKRKKHAILASRDTIFMLGR